MSEPSLSDKVVQLHQALAGNAVPHAFGGALALAYYAEPRATIDVDVNIFLPPGEHRAVAAALAPLGFDTSLPRVDLDGQGRLRWGRTPVDLFYSYLPFHEAMRDAVRVEPFGDATIPILAPEHLLVCKVSFDRPKDWLDIDEMVAGNAALDWTEIDRWTSAILGATDPRLERLRGRRP